MHSNRFSLRLRVCAIFFCSLALTFAQSNRGGISGNVTDQSGASVPNAVVTITNTGTNETRKLTTDGKGSFIQENLEPAVYNVQVLAKGFAKALVEQVKVDTATVATANVIVQPGNVSTQVTVTANANLVNTESGTLSQTISGRELNDLPLANRSVLDLAVTIPNISGDVGSEDPQISGGPPLPGFNLNTNGGRSGSTTMLADGVGNTGVGLAREAVSFSPEAVQEITVSTNGFDAQYGKTGGGIISITTKSGTNDFNGLALWYLRNPLLNAAPYTQASVNRPVQNLRWNQFDGQLAGPVIIPKLYNGRNKTFFFFAGEPRYQSNHVQAVANVPTADERSGNFNNLVAVAGVPAGGLGFAPASIKNQFPASAFPPGNFVTTIYNKYIQNGNQFTIAPPPAVGSTYPVFPNNTIPASMLDPTSLKLLQYLPKPNTPYFLDSNGYINNYVTSRYIADNATRYNLKIDENISDRNHVSFRLTDVPQIGISGTDPLYPINGGGATYSDSHQYLLSDTLTISPTVVNEIRLAYTRANFSGTVPPAYDINTGRNISTENGLPSLTKGGIPAFSFELASYGGIGSQGSTQNNNLEQQYEIADNVYVTRGAMTWKFGVDLSRALLNSLNFYAADGGNYSFRFLQTDSVGGGSSAQQATLGGNAFASFLLGVPQAVTLSTSLIPYYYRWNSAAAFVQNDWKVSPNLTLNIGLRYSLQTPRVEQYNHQGFFDPSLPKTIQLATPCQLPDCTGTGAAFGFPVVTQATEIPFAFAGYGGRSRYLTPLRPLDFEPRFGFAYSPHFFGDNNWVVRGGYGLSHAPLTGQNRNPVPNFAGGAGGFGELTGQTNPAFVTRLSSNPPVEPLIGTNTVLGLANNPSGLIYDNAINFPAYIRSGESAVPYVQNWTLSIQRQFGGKNLLEVSYAGSKGTHLFMPQVNINNPYPGYLAALQNDGYTATFSVADPLGRLQANGAPYRPLANSLASPYLGFGGVFTFFDASGNSTFHAAIVSLRHRSDHGFTGYANFRWSKSIDNASDATPDPGSLTTGKVNGGQYSLGAAASNDRAVSTYNIPYDANFVAVYDLPYGKGRPFGANAWYPLRAVFGDWTLSGVERFYSGYPITPTISSDAYVNSVITHEIRPDIVSGVPLKNPLYSRSCPSTTNCQPYLNIAAFQLPPAGQLGDAPRTLGGLTGPMINSADLSVQKSWKFRGEKNRSIQLRVDAINAFNNPVFRIPGNNGSNSPTDLFGGYPAFNLINTTAATASNDIQTIYKAWATVNGQPAGTTPAGMANIAKIAAFTTATENNHNVLPNNFYSIPLPVGFALSNANSFDITTLQGFKLYQIRQNTNTGGGSLVQNANLNPPRYVQLGLKITF